LRVQTQKSKKSKKFEVSNIFGEAILENSDKINISVCDTSTEIDISIDS